MPRRSRLAEENIALAKKSVKGQASQRRNTRFHSCLVCDWRFLGLWWYTRHSSLMVMRRVVARYVAPWRRGAPRRAPGEGAGQALPPRVLGYQFV